MLTCSSRCRSGMLPAKHANGAKKSQGTFLTSPTSGKDFSRVSRVSRATSCRYIYALVEDISDNV
jgi:hypothetical protein